MIILNLSISDIPIRLNPGCGGMGGRMSVYQYQVLRVWLVGFVALRPKSTAMVIAGRSVYLTTLFPGQA